MKIGTDGQNKYTASATGLSDKFSKMNTRGAAPPPWNTKYTQNYSKTAEHQVVQPSNKTNFYDVEQPSQKTNFYEEEYKKMVSRIDDVVPAKNEKMADPFEELLQLSVRADEGFERMELGSSIGSETSNDGSVRSSTTSSIGSQTPIVTPPFNKRSSKRLSIKNLLQWKRVQDKKHEVFMSMMRKLQQQDKARFQRKRLQRMTPITNAYEKGTTGGSSPQEKPQERLESMSKKKLPAARYEEDPLCHHYGDGYCRRQRRSEGCDFQHTLESSYPDCQKVYLGGLPRSITTSKLVWELRQKGYNIINRPKIYRGFSPQVCLATIKEARKLIQQEKIQINGCAVEVRPYNTFTKKELNRPDISKRSVIPGGRPWPSVHSVHKLEAEKTRSVIPAELTQNVPLANVQQAQN